MGLESLGKKLAQLGQDTVSTVQKTAESVQLNNKIADQRKVIEKLFAQVGESVFEKAGDTIPEGLEDVFAALKTAKEALADLENQKAKVKAKPACPSCGKEVFKGENFCSACGADLSSVWEEDTAQEEEESTGADTLKADAQAAANEVGDIVNEAASKARGILGGFAEAADAFVKGVASKMNEKKEEAEDEAEEEMDESAEELQDIFDDAEQAACEAEEAVEEAADKAEEAVEEAADKAEEAVEEAVNKVEEVAEEAADKVKEAAEEAAGDAE